jgi:hypothetical protein
MTKLKRVTFKLTSASIICKIKCGGILGVWLEVLDGDLETPINVATTAENRPVYRFQVDVRT